MGRTRARTRTLFKKSGTAVLPPYQEMRVNQFLTSPNGRYQLIVREDSTLVLYEAGQVIWRADEHAAYSAILRYRGTGPAALYVQYGAFFQNPETAELWITTPTDFIEADQWNRVHLVLQDDGNIVQVDHQPLWSSNGTTPAFGKGTIIPRGTVLEPGRAYGTKSARVVFHADGDLVLFSKENVPVWASGTAGQGAIRAEFQSNGNLVLYNSHNEIVWSVVNNADGEVFLQVRSDSIAIVKHSLIWARFGYAPTIKPKRVINPITFSYSWKF